MSKSTIKRFYCPNCGSTQLFNRENKCVKCNHQIEKIVLIDKFKENILFKITIILFIIWPIFFYLNWVNEYYDYYYIITFVIMFLISIYLETRIANTNEIKKYSIKKFGTPLNSKEIKKYYCRNCGNIQHFSKGNQCNKCNNLSNLIKINDKYSLINYKTYLFFLISFNIFWFVYVFITGGGPVYWRLNELTNNRGGYIVGIGFILWIITFIFIFLYLFRIHRTNTVVNSEIREISFKQYGNPNSYKRNVKNDVKNSNIVQTTNNLKKGKIQIELIEEGIKKLLDLNSNIFINDIKKCISNNKPQKAFELLEDREKEYHKLLEFEEELKDIKEKIKGLTNRVSNGDLSSEAFTTAHNGLEREQKEIEESLWKLKNKIFKDKYEKPF